MKKLLSGLLVALACTISRAEPTKTVFNPFTGKLDYITTISTASISAGTGIVVSCTNGKCTITSSGSSASNLEAIFGTSRSSPTSTLNGYSGDFIGTVINGTTMYFSLNPNTTDFIHNVQSLQSGATFYVSSGTAQSFNANTVNATTATIASSLFVNSNNSMIYATNGRIGIFNGSPLQPLDINGNVSFNSALMPAGQAGNTFTLLHSQGAGVAPTWSAVDLGNDVTSNLPVTNLNSGTNATSSTFWRGDGTWVSSSTFGGGGSFINNSSSLQSGATFYVSSGTVDQQFNIGGANGSLIQMNGGGFTAYTAPSPSISPIGTLSMQNASTAGSPKGFRFDGTEGWRFGIDTITSGNGQVKSRIPVNISSATTLTGELFISSGIALSGSEGTNGQLLTSAGAGGIPTWTTVSSGGSGGANIVNNGTIYQAPYYSVNSSSNTLSASSTFNIFPSSISETGNAGMVVTYGASMGSVTVTGAGTGSLNLTEGASSSAQASTSGQDIFWADSSSHAISGTFNGSASTYTYISSSFTPVANQYLFWVPGGPNGWVVGSTAPAGSGGGGGGTPATPFNSVQYNNAGSFGGSSNFQFNGTSVTVVSSMTLNTGGCTTTVPGLSVICDGNAYTGKSLLTIASQNHTNFYVEDGAGIFAPGGASIGANQITIGGASLPNGIYLYNNGTNEIDLGNTAGQITLQTTSNANGGTGNPIVFQPANVTAVVISSFGVTVSTQTTYTSSVTINAPLSMGSNLINNVTNPINAQDAATKNYVDTSVTGLDYKGAAYLGTAAALPANLYVNGASGVGATLTEVGFGALTVDGQAVSTTQRILVKNELNGVNNGIYTVTATGGGAASYILTRATDYNQASEIQPGDAVFVTSGTANASTGWVMTNETFTTVGTSTITWAQFAGPGSGVTTVNSSGNAAITGAVTLVGGTNVTLSQSGSSITITAASGGGGSGVGTINNANQFSVPYYSVQGSSNVLSSFPGTTASTTTGIVTISTLTVSTFTVTKEALLPAATFFTQPGATTPSVNLSSVTVINGITSNDTVGGGSTGIIVNQYDTTNNPSGEIINSSTTNNGLIVNAFGTNYGTNNTSGAMAVNCGQRTQGNCATFYNDGGVQNVLNGVVTIIQDSPTWNTVTAYMIAGADNPQNGWRLDGYDYSTLELIDTLKDGAGPGGGAGTIHNGKGQISEHNGQLRGEIRAADNSGFIPGWQLADSTATGVMSVGHVYGVPVSTLEVQGGLTVGNGIAGASGSGVGAPANGIISQGNITVQSSVTVQSGGVLAAQGGIQISSGINVAVPSVITATMTLTSTMSVVLASCTATSTTNKFITLTLPAASQSGTDITVYDMSPDTCAIHIQAGSGDLIESTGTLYLNAKTQHANVHALGFNTWGAGLGGIQYTPSRIARIQQLNGGFSVGTSSTQIMCAIDIPVPVIATGFAFYQNSAANMAFGLLDASGNVVVSTGPVNNTGAQALKITPTQVPPGRYFIAALVSATTANLMDGAGTNNSPATAACAATIEAGQSTIQSVPLASMVTVNLVPSIHLLVNGGDTTFQ